MPTLPEEKLASSYLYHDATVDDARLSLTVARTAAIEFGAVAVNGAALVGIDKDSQGMVRGARVLADGQEISVRCSAIVNAAGVWSDEVRTFDEGADPDSIRPAKGIHITVPWEKVRNDIAVVVPVPKDKRAVFVVPWGDLTYIGTTDTDYDGPNEDPPVTRADVDYLLDAMKFTGITDKDVVGTLGRPPPAGQERRHAAAPPTCPAATRWWPRRRASSRSRAASSPPTARWPPTRSTRSCTCWAPRSRASPAARAPRSSACAAPRATRPSPATTTPSSTTWPTATAARAARSSPWPRPTRRSREPLVAGLPYLRAEAVYAVRHEMARSVDDVLSRRTRARLLARDASAAAADDVASLIAPLLGLSEAEAAAQAADYRAAVERERTTAELPETALDAHLGA